MEDSYTWQIPYYYLLCAAENLHGMLLESSNNLSGYITSEDVEMTEGVIMKYHEQIRLLKRNLDGLAESKVGPRSFKPSSAKNAKGLEGVALNMHLYRMEVEKDKDKYSEKDNLVDTYDIVTMGCPSVHAVKTKLGGIRKQILNRLHTREAKAVKHKRVSVIAPSYTLPKSPSIKNAFHRLSNSLSGEMFNFVGPDSVGSFEGDRINSAPLSEVEKPKGDVIYNGYLNKKGNAITGEKKRFFILNAVSLDYYKSPSTATPLGSIPINDIILVRVTEVCSFDILTSHRLYSLTADNNEECNTWVEVINEELSRKNRKRNRSVVSEEAENGEKERPSFNTDGSSPSLTIIDPTTGIPIILLKEIVDHNIYLDNTAEKHDELIEESRWMKEPMILCGWMERSHI